MQQEYDFPAIRAAITERKHTHEVCRKLGAQPSFREYELRAEWNRKHDASEAALAAVVSAYAVELLPAILGGEWKTTRASLYVPDGRRGLGSYVAGEISGLFDHPVHLRRSPATPRRGSSKLTWDNCALIGQPYLSVHARERDKLPDRDAIALAERFGVGVWTRDDLSGWYPGWTVLVLAAKGLLPEQAAGFGFVALA